MSEIKVGEIRRVSGGYGLMKVIEYDPVFLSAKMQEHGNSTRWFFADRLGEPVGREEVKLEWGRACIRGYACNNPDCWCVEYRK